MGTLNIYYNITQLVSLKNASTFANNADKAAYYEYVCVLFKSEIPLRGDDRLTIVVTTMTTVTAYQSLQLSILSSCPVADA